MTNEKALEILKSIEILSFRDKKRKYFMRDVWKAQKVAIEALEIELLTDTEQRIFLKAINREREVCQKVDDEYSDNDSKISLVKVCNSIERKVKKIWE